MLSSSFHSCHKVINITEPIENTMDSSESCIGGASVSLSSTPRKSQSKKSTSRQVETNPESAAVSSGVPALSSSALHCSRVLAESEGSDVVDKAAYLLLYDEVLELRSELEKARRTKLSPSQISAAAT